MDEKREHAFITEMWRYMRKHRKYTKAAWTDGDELLIKYNDIPYAPEMVKAYLDNIEDEVIK